MKMMRIRKMPKGIYDRHNSKINIMQGVYLEPRLKIVIDAMIQNGCSEDEMVFVMYQSNPAWNHSCDRLSTDPAEIYEKYMTIRKTIKAYLDQEG
jgi:hypothetical protein